MALTDPLRHTPEPDQTHAEANDDGEVITFPGVERQGDTEATETAPATTTGGQLEPSQPGRLTRVKGRLTCVKDGVKNDLSAAWQAGRHGAYWRDRPPAPRDLETRVDRMRDEGADVVWPRVQIPADRVCARWVWGLYILAWATCRGKRAVITAPVLAGAYGLQVWFWIWLLT